MRRLGLCTVIWLAALTGPALAAFPFERQGGPSEYGKYKLPAGKPVPGDLQGKLSWMYSSTPAAPAPPAVVNPLTLDRRELGGVRGGWVVDASRDAPQAWHTTTGRPDVTIAVIDSGIKWNDLGGMRDLRLKTRISTGESPVPASDRATALEPGVDCAGYADTGRDLNADGVFNVLDYACDARVSAAPAKGVGPVENGAPMLDPQDVLIAFSDGDDDDGNGYVDDLVGWDFLDDDNDPFDDVQYGHGTGEARDSAAEAANGGDLGTCANCMQIHLRVGTSFVADVNRFAMATIYATDNGAEVVQEALGTLNKSAVGAEAVKYAYDHGTTVIASAADEAAQHHNWPSSYPYSIVVNSVTHFDEADQGTQLSYLQFNGCTNFSSRITLAIPSVSCSSDATGRGAGMAGLIYSAALNAAAAGKLAPHPRCVRTDGRPCLLTPNEIRQIMASGTFGTTPAADDVNFAVDPVTGADTDQNTCGKATAPGCTDPFASVSATALPRLSLPTSYPARKGHDQFYGYGRVNMDRAVGAIHPGADTNAASDDTNATVPPEVEVTSPEWYETVDPAAGSLKIRGEVWARGREYTCRVFVAPGAYPKDTAAPDGDFVEFSRSECAGTPRTSRVDGVIAEIGMDDVKALFGATVGNFRGQEGGSTGQTPNPTGNVGRPNDEPYAFTVKVIATTTGAAPLSGTDRRQAYLHRDQDMLDGFPMHLPGDVEASPVLADLDGDNRNELLLANSDGVIHAWRRNGSELPGYPVRTDRLMPGHDGARAFATGTVSKPYGAVLATPAVGDLERDGTLEVVIADLEGKVYIFDGATGERRRTIATPRAYAGIPQAPFENIRGVGPDGTFVDKLGPLHRQQLGFIGAPVLADVDRDDGGRLEIVAASLDRHVYVWNDTGSDVPGWPLPIVDRSKLRDAKPQIDPVSHRPFFDLAKTGDTLEQGAIVDTPAVGDLTGDGRPEIVIGTNEEYAANSGNEGGLNAGGLNEAVYAPLGAALSLANGRLYAIKPDGDTDGDVNAGVDPWLPGWPFKVGILQAGILPLVGEGITGSPVIGDVTCQGTTRAPRVGVIPAAGVPYVVNPDGQSCLGRQNGKDTGLQTEGVGSDPAILPAFGHPVFAEFAGGSVFIAPAAGIARALDVVSPEYQGGQDYLVTWDLSSPQGPVRPGWPAAVNDLSFLTGPSVADLGPGEGEEVVTATAHHDIQGFNQAGGDMASDWPKLSGDWSVANPTIGSFGVLETSAGATKSIIAGTRNGRLNAYDAGVPACAAASWPRFHHDLANSGDTRRDAVPPGTPTDAGLNAANALVLSQPGDDLLCGTAKTFDVRTSEDPITPDVFGRATTIGTTGAPGTPGTIATLPLTGTLRRFVAVRVVDEQGNVSRPAVVDRGAGAQPLVVGPPVTPVVPIGPAKPRVTPKCAARSARLGTSGFGAFRLGRDVTRMVALAGNPSRYRRSALYWCITRGGGLIRVAFDRKGKAVVIATTGPLHRYGRLRKGVKLSVVRRAFKGTVRLKGRKGLYTVKRGSKVIFGLRAGRVRYVAVTTSALARNGKSLRTYLGRAGL